MASIPSLAVAIAIALGAGLGVVNGVHGGMGQGARSRGDARNACDLSRRAGRPLRREDRDNRQPAPMAYRSSPCQRRADWRSRHPRPVHTRGRHRDRIPGRNELSQLRSAVLCDRLQSRSSAAHRTADEGRRLRRLRDLRRALRARAASCFSRVSATSRSRPDAAWSSAWSPLSSSAV